MSSIRYFNAFVLSSLTFAFVYLAFLSLPKTEKKLNPAPSKVIKIALVTPIKKVVKPIEVKPKVIKPVIPPVIKKPIIKKIIKKKIIKKHKPKKFVRRKVIKKKVIKKKIIKRKVLKKRIIKKKIKHKKIIQKKIIKKRSVPKIEPQYIPTAVYVPPKPIEQPRRLPTPPAPVYVAPEPVIKATPQATNPRKNNRHKKAFLRNVRANIIANKRYPRIAKRRHIEGDIKVRFNIMKNGEVSNIRFINGKHIFYKSVKKAIEETFPLTIPSNVKNELPIMDVSLTLHFHIR